MPDNTIHLCLSPHKEKTELKCHMKTIQKLILYIILHISKWSVKIFHPFSTLEFFLFLLFAWWALHSLLIFVECGLSLSSFDSKECYISTVLHHKPQHGSKRSRYCKAVHIEWCSCAIVCSLITVLCMCELHPASRMLGPKFPKRIMTMTMTVTDNCKPLGDVGIDIHFVLCDYHDRLTRIKYSRIDSPRHWLYWRLSVSLVSLAEHAVMCW